MPSYLIVLVAVVAGWLVQMYLTYQQSMAFNSAVRRLRRSGTVSVGVAGRRYRGGRAYVALAVDDRGIVADAISLRGWTTFARARTLPALVGRKVNQVAGDREIPGLREQQRDAARQAVDLLRRERSKADTNDVTPSPA
jgi:DNA-binding transcriptional regulator of glucitol operon